MKCKKCNFEFQPADACLVPAGVHTKILCPLCDFFCGFVQQSSIGPDYVLPFGKYAGSTIQEVPHYYIVFLAEGRGKIARYCQQLLKNMEEQKNENN